MRTAAILPVKRFARAKQRLGASVDDPLRRELAEAMVADVLLALAQTEAIERTIVITAEESVASAAVLQGAIVIADHAESGQSAAVELETLLASGSEDVRGGGVVIIPDRHGSGTNGLLLTPPDAIAPSFGPDSCERHRAAALAAAAPCRLERPGSLLLDIDTGADLAALRERLAGASTRAAATRAVLERSEQDQALARMSAG